MKDEERKMKEMSVPSINNSSIKIDGKLYNIEVKLRYQKSRKYSSIFKYFL